MLQSHVLKESLLVAIFGGLGCVLRHRIDILVNVPLGSFPSGTLFINLSGSFLIGCLATISENQLNSELRLLLTAGLLGGFTTFSAFSLQSVQLLKQDHFFLAAIYLATSVLGGLLFCWLGFALTKLLMGQN